MLVFGPESSFHLVFPKESPLICIIIYQIRREKVEYLGMKRYAGVLSGWVARGNFRHKEYLPSDPRILTRGISTL